MAQKTLHTYFDNPTKAATTATKALPGTVRKQIVFAIRVWRDEELHHMDDEQEQGIGDDAKHIRFWLRQAVEAKRALDEARGKLALSVPEIDDEVFEAVAAGRLSFEVLDKIREI